MFDGLNEVDSGSEEEEEKVCRGGEGMDLESVGVGWRM